MQVIVNFFLSFIASGTASSGNFLKTKWQHNCRRVTSGWLISFLLTALLAFSPNLLTGTANADSAKSLAVPYVNEKTAQQTPFQGIWTYCGPSSAAMVLGYYSKTSDPTKEAATNLQSKLFSWGTESTVWGGSSNDPSYTLHKVMESYGISNRVTAQGNYLSFDQITAEIDAGRPVLFGQSYYTGTKQEIDHISVILGYDKSTMSLIVNDPFGAYGWWSGFYSGGSAGKINGVNGPDRGISQSYPYSDFVNHVGNMMVLTTNPSSSTSTSTPGKAVQIKGLGFDTCPALSIAEMQTWKNNSPYNSVGIYIGGEHGCSDTYDYSRVTTAYITAVFNMGWNVIPIWFGPQASCNDPRNDPIPTDPNAATARGIVEADKAIDNRAAGLGFGQGSVIYYDIEGYDNCPTYNADRAGVKAFVAGWVQELHQRHYVAGVYGGVVASFAGDWATLGNNTPDAVWLGAANGDPSVFGLHDGDHTPQQFDALWSSSQRIHQYTINVQQNWGDGNKITIDLDGLDGWVAGSGTNSITIGQNSAFPQNFVDAFNRGGNTAQAWGTPIGPVSWFSNSRGIQGATVQQFRGGAAGDTEIFMNESGVYNGSSPANIRAYVLHGGILAAYLQTGGPDGKLGVPTSDEFQNNGGLPQVNFANGYIIWDKGNAQINMWPQNDNSGWFFQEYNNPDLASGPTIVRNVNNDINFGWNANPVFQMEGMEFTENWSARFQRNYTFPAGNYTFKMCADDGARLYLAGKVAIDAWRTGAGCYNFTTIYNTDTTEVVQLEYSQILNPSAFSLNVSSQPLSSVTATISPTDMPIPSSTPTVNVPSPTPTPTPSTTPSGVVIEPTTPTPTLTGDNVPHPATDPDPAFHNVWSHTDEPVAEGIAARSWIWGPMPNGLYDELYNGTMRLVQYYDKSRMEVNNPDGDRSNPFFVTNGLLVKELISGKIQVGDNAFVQRQPSIVPLAGDPNNLGQNPNSPTYASLQNIASLNNNNRAANLVGQVVTTGLTKDGSTQNLTSTPATVRYAYYDSNLGHNIPDVFWNFMHNKGLVLTNGNYQTDTIVDWVYAMGYPISEPYWIKTKVGGVERDVLMQAFERRILTYTPSNSADFQVEMGNVGQHYFRWRYGIQ